MPNTVYLLGGVIIYQTLFKSVFSYLLTNSILSPGIQEAVEEMTVKSISSF